MVKRRMDVWKRELCIEMHRSALVLVFTVATLTSYTLSEWDLTPYDSVPERQSLTDRSSSYTHDWMWKIN